MRAGLFRAKTYHVNDRLQYPLAGIFIPFAEYATAYYETHW